MLPPRVNQGLLNLSGKNPSFRVTPPLGTRGPAFAAITIPQLSVRPCGTREEARERERERERARARERENLLGTVCVSLFYVIDICSTGSLGRTWGLRAYTPHPNSDAGYASTPNFIGCPSEPVRDLLCIMEG